MIVREAFQAQEQAAATQLSGAGRAVLARQPDPDRLPQDPQPAEESFPGLLPIVEAPPAVRTASAIEQGLAGPPPHLPEAEASDFGAAALETAAFQEGRAAVFQQEAVGALQLEAG